jgi:hypothetical protein
MVGVAQRYLRRGRSWFTARPAWAKIVIVLLLIGLLPWLLVVAGLMIAGIGVVGLFRGALPSFRLGSRGAAAGALLVGLMSIATGSGLAVSVLTSASTSPPRIDPPIAAPTTFSAPSTTPAPKSPPPTTASPSPPRRTATVPPRKPTTTPPPAPRPSTTRPAPPLTVTIVGLPPTGQGNVATATARTAPNANCSIDVEYKSGPSTAAGLYPKTASASGTVAWSWKVGTRTTPGTWPVTVTCTRRGATESDQRLLTVFDTGSPG